MKNAGTLDLARAAIAKRRAPGQIAPSKYLPGVPRQVHAAGGRAYPLDDRSGWYGDANYEQTGGKMVMMSPDEYLAKVRPLDIDEASRDNIDDLKQHIMAGRKLDPLKIDAKGKEDGRHRAHAAKELGIKQVPVLTWPREERAAGGKVDDARADFLAGNHPEVPPVVYHSTKNNFHAFRPMSHFGTEKAAHDRYKVGPWNPSHLEMDRNLHNISVIPAHISLKNPIDVGTERDWRGNRDTLRQVANWMGRKLDKKYAYARQKLKDLIGDTRWGDYPQLMEQRGAEIIRDTGHDGIVYTNTIEDPGSRSFITLGPEQVKSAISAREFDPENPDMTKAEGGPVDLNVERARKNIASGELPEHIQNTFDSMAERNRAQLSAHQEAMQAGAFDDTRIGDEYRAPNGSTFKITNHFMMPANRWGGREPPSMVYQGHVPMVSTVYTDPKMKGFDMNRAVEHVRQMERIGGPLRVAKAGGGDVEDLGVHRFHRQLSNEVKSTMNDMVDAHQKALQAGVFDGYEVGDRLQGQVGPLTVKARYMAKWKPGGASDKTIQRMGQIPTLMDHNGVTYHPMVRLTGADGSEGDYPLDAVRGYPKFTGLRVAKKNGGGVKLYSKAAQIIRGLPQAKGKAEDMVKAALGKGAKRAELEHADVAPGMASRDQVADYLEAVQPRIVVKRKGEGEGLTAQERDELGYLRSMMPHQRTPENDQRIAELKEKQFSSPQYEQYQLPGGTNYREHILTLPDQADEYFANSHWGNISNPIAHVRMSDRAAPSGMSPWDWMDAHDRMMKAVGVTDPGSLAAGAPDTAVAKGAITPEEARAIAVDYGWTGSKYYKPKKILHVEELQSDWNSDARRRGFKTGTEQEDYDNFVKDMRQKAVDATGPDQHNKFMEMDPHSLALKMGQQEEHNRLYRRAKFPGPPKAPYVNPKSDDWAELAMKHVLHEAAQGGYDGITFTPDAEQSKRWGGTEFKGMYDKKFPNIAHRLVQQHDPSITPSTTPITPFLQGPMIPLTEQARRGILENGFSSFKKGGYVR